MATYDYFDGLKNETLTIYWPKAWVSYYETNIKKNGKPGMRLDFRSRDVTPLMNCAMCHHLKTPRKIRTSFYLWYVAEQITKKNYYQYYDASKCDLCIGCWNKVRAIEKKENKLKENIKQTKELTTFIYREKKRIKNERT